MEEIRLHNELIDRRVELVGAIARRDPNWRWLAAEVAHLAGALEACRSQLRASADSDALSLERAIGW